MEKSGESKNYRGHEVDDLGRKQKKKKGHLRRQNQYRRLELSLWSKFSGTIRAGFQKVTTNAGKTVIFYWRSPLMLRMARNAAGESYTNASESEL